MPLAIAFTLYVKDFSKFLKRTDFAQSIFLANLFAIGWPRENFREFLCVFFIPYLASNAILISIETLKKHTRPAVHIEHFHNFFSENKIISFALFVAILFLSGIPPVQGIFWRMKFLGALYDGGHKLSFAIFIVCFCSLGYIYLKWLLAAISQKKCAAASGIPHPHANGIISFAAMCAFGIIICEFPLLN
jgi:NADH:ubiquinone oxidoreductase subunit 2 (subunit N)